MDLMNPVAVALADLPDGRCTRQGFDIGRGTISHIETGLRGVSDLEMVLIAKALRVKLDELLPGGLPAWRKDLRPPTARVGDGE